MAGARLIETLEGVVWLLTPVAELVVVASIKRCKLTGSFPVFIGFLLFDVLRSAVLWWLGQSPFSNAYRDIWIATEPVFLALEFLVVLELYRLLYRAYPGIHSFARGLIAIGIMIAFAVTFGTVKVDLGRIVWTVPDLQRLFLVKRVVCSILALLVLTTMALFPRAPSAKNVLLHGWLLAALLSTAALGFFAINVGSSTEWIGTLFLIFQLMCFVGWAFGFQKSQPPPPAPSPEETRKIEELNAELLAVARWLAH